MYEIRPQVRTMWPLVSVFLVIAGSVLVLVAVNGIDSPRDVLAVLAMPVLVFCSVYMVLMFTNSRFAVAGSTITRTDAFRRTTTHELSQVSRVIFAHHVSNGLSRPISYLVFVKPDGQLLFRLTSPMWSVVDITAFLNATGRAAEVITQPISVAQLRAMSPSSASWHEARPWAIPLIVIGALFGIPLVIGIILIAVSFATP